MWEEYCEEMPARVRLTYDGKVKVKVPGRRREVFEVPFLDKYRKRAFRNLRFTLQHLNMEIIEEESIKRAIEVSYEDEGVIHNHKLQVEDKTLHALFIPPQGTHRLCPSLKGKYKIIFSYEGKGVFNASPVGELSEKEKEDIERFVRYILRPHYSLAFINDSALQNIQNKEANNEVATQILGNEDSIEKRSEPQEVTDAIRTEKQRKIQKHKHQGKKEKLFISSEKVTAIEEIKAKIKKFKPRGLKENLAYRRYLQALSYAPDKREEIDKLFYNEIVERKNFERFYRHLYLLIPKLIESALP